MKLNGKTALVTGAGAGIGRATAIAFAEAGADVVATDMNDELLGDLGDRGMRTRKLDVTDSNQIAATHAEVSNIDILFNCAGFVHHGTIMDCDEEAWDFTFNLNAKAMYQMIRAFLPGMLENGGGNIINIASVVSSQIAAPNRFVYGASKAAVIGMTKSVAADFITQGVRCNAICPGTVNSPSLTKRLEATGDYEKAHAEFVARQPMGRIADAEEIAALAVFLASDDSAFMTGQAVGIDGGWSNV